MQELIVFGIVGVAAIYLGRKFFGKSGSSCGCGCSCSAPSKCEDESCSEKSSTDEHRQK